MLKVKRVFLYDDEIFKQNVKHHKIWPGVVLCYAFVIVAFIIKDLPPIIILTISLIFLIAIEYYFIGLKVKNRRGTAWAISEDDRIFFIERIMGKHSMGGIRINGIHIKDIINGKVPGSPLSPTVKLHELNTNLYMQNPDVIAALVEKGPDIYGASVIEILKVHSLNEDKEKAKIKCDLKILKTNEIEYNITINLEKAYKGTNDLIAILKSKI